MICLRTGMPEASPCPRCVEHERRLSHARKDPEVARLRDENEAAWRSYRAGHDLPLLAWEALESTWRAACHAAQAAFLAALARYDAEARES